MTSWRNTTAEIAERKGLIAIELTGKIQDLSIDFITGKAKLTLEVNEKQSAMQVYEELHNCEKLSIKISKYREKRSLDANAYFWVLADKLAAKLNVTKEEIYRNSIKEIGGNSEIVCVKNEAVERLCEGWRLNGIGWQTDTMPSKIDGCTNVILYYGSSTYNTAQMTLLINNIVEDCKAQGIETRTPNEIAEMLSLWEQKEAR